MHILYLSSSGGGLDTGVRVLAPALVQAGHKVSVLYIHVPGDSGSGTESTNGFQVYHAAVGNWHYYARRATLGLITLPRVVRGFESARALSQAVVRIEQQSRVDLLELPEGFVFPQLLARVPVVMRLHSSAWMCNRLFNEPPALADSIEERLEGQTLARVHGISSPSAFVAGYVRNACRVDRRIEVIPYPVDTGQFTPGAARVDQGLILFVGRVEKRKGADFLLSAIPQVLAKYPHAQFAFAGRVADELKAMEVAQPPNVQFLGVLPRQELVHWYQRASLLVLPTLWDNSPNVIYEAMACATPVVASRVGGIPELVDDGITGLLVPPRDPEALAGAIIDLLGDSARREQMGQCGREKAVALYSVDRIAVQTLRSYERALG